MWLCAGGGVSVGAAVSIRGLIGNPERGDGLNHFEWASRLIRLARAAAWLGLLGVAVLSLVTGAWRPHTPMPGQAEHFLAYFLTSFAFGVGYPDRRTRMIACAGLCLAAGLFELLQNWSPGRSPNLLDWAASSAGAVAGILLAWPVPSLLRRSKPG